MIKKIADKYRRIPLGVKVAFWYMVCNFFQKGISTLTTPIFTRLMNTTEYGEFTLFTSWQSILLVIVSLKLSGGVYQQGLVKFEDDKDRFTSSLLGLSTTLVLAFFVLYLLFRHSFNGLFDMSTAVMVGMFASILATCTFSLWSYRCRMDYDYIPLVIITLLVGIAKPLVGIIAVINSTEKGTARIFSVVAVEVVVYLFLYIAIFRKNHVFFDKKFWSYSLAFNIPLIPHFLSQSILIQSDRIMIKEICGSSFVGIYGLAYSISMMMNLVNNAVNDTLVPWIYKSIKDKRYVELRNVSSNIILLIAVADLLVIGLAPELIHIFAPPEYSDAIWIIPPVSMSIFFTFLYCFYADFEYYYEKTKFIMAASVFSAGLNIALNYVFIHLYGYIAAGYTTLVCYIVYCLLHYYNYNRIKKKEIGRDEIYDSRRILVISVFFIAIGFVLMLLYKTLIARYALVVSIGVYLILKRKDILAIFRMRRDKVIK